MAADTESHYYAPDSTATAHYHGKQPAPGSPGTYTTSSQEQFKLLRSRLDQLGYFELFSPDAHSLVLRLLNDLVQTTESCKRLKVASDNNAQERRRLEADVLY